MVWQTYQAAQARRELEDKVLTYADNAALTLPVPYVGETVGVLGAGIGAGIRGARAVQQAGRGELLAAAGNATGAVLGVLGGNLNRFAAERRIVSNLAARPTFGTGSVQAEADAGAEWVRDWIKGRSAASMGGLSPANAPVSTAIKRPIAVENPATWKALGFDHRTDGVYYPSHDIAVVSPYSNQPRSTAVHEVTHQFQKAMRHEPGMQTALSTIDQQRPVSGFAQSAFDRYQANPIEIHARLMEVRHELGYKPWDVITEERLSKDLDKIGVGSKAMVLWSQYPNQIAGWLNKAPSVALPSAGGAGAAGVVASQPTSQ